MPESIETRSRMAALASLAPILFGVGFCVYAFAVGSITKTTIVGGVAVTKQETIVEAGGPAGVFLAFAPLVLGVFVAFLLYLARRDQDTAPLVIAWALSGFVTILSLIGMLTVGRFTFLPALLMLLATGANHAFVNEQRRTTNPD